MNAQEWRAKLSDVVKGWRLSPEAQDFYSLKVTPERAKLYMLQLSIYIRNRRNYWPQVAANCPEMKVKQRILAHEYEELVEDEYSAVGHLDLVFRQAHELGLSVEEVLNAEPIPSTRAAVYAWWWLARNRPWQEALAASTTAEWFNDDRLLEEYGGGNCSSLFRNWTRDLGFRPEQMPNFTAHSKADEKHSDMFLDILEAFVPPEAQKGVINTVTESYEIIKEYFGGMATAMKRLS